MSDLEKWNVHGPVKTLRKEFAEWDVATKDWKTPKGYTFVEFRPDGQLSKVEVHNPDGSIMRQNFIYDEAGRLQSIGSQMNDQSPSQSLLRYDDRGRLVRTTQLDPNGVRTDSEIYSYDSIGRKTKVTFLQRSPGVKTVGYMIEDSEQGFSQPGAATLTTSYDEKDRATETLVHDSAHQLLQQIIMTRDEAGRLLKVEALAAGRSPFSEFEKVASAEERAQIKEALAKMFAPGKVTISTAYSYDSKGRLIERHSNLFDMEEDRHSFVFDEQDNPVSEEMESYGDSPHRQHNRFAYDYDSKGNWTRRCVSYQLENAEDFQNSHIERRIITYY